MAKILKQRDVEAGFKSESDNYWCYNGLDCIITRDVHQVIRHRVDDDLDVQRICEFEMACQSPALTMMLRGAAFDERACSLALKWHYQEETRLVEACNTAIGSRWTATQRRKGKCEDGKPHYWSNSVRALKKGGEEHVDKEAVCLKCSLSRMIAKAFNPLSSQQVVYLLYDLLDLEEQRSKKGDHAVTADDEAISHLIEITEEDEDAKVCRAILDCRQNHKQIGFLKSRRSADGRLRQSVNVGATETGRWSASKDPFREGTNFQNIADRSRNVIVADPGLWLFYADLEQAESRIVAYDAECEQDIADHLGGDTHTLLCKTLFPELDWGEGKTDREVAETKLSWDAEHDYRHIAKITRHGTNIGMSGLGIAREIHKPKKFGDEMREAYFERYPEDLSRQKEIKALVKETGVMSSPLRRKRQFFGRLWDAGTQREGLAFTQQTTVAELLNLALWFCWSELDTVVNIFNPPRPSDPTRIWLLAQVHDAILGMCRPHDYGTIQRIRELMEIPLKIHGRTCMIPVEIMLGQNFRHFNPRKPETVGGLTAKWDLNVDGTITIHNTRKDLK